MLKKLFKWRSDAEDVEDLLHVSSVTLLGRSIDVAYFRDKVYVKLTSFSPLVGVATNTLTSHAKKLKIRMVKDEAFVQACTERGIKFLDAPHQSYLDVDDMLRIAKSFRWRSSKELETLASQVGALKSRQEKLPVAPKLSTKERLVFSHLCLGEADTIIPFALFNDVGYEPVIYVSVCKVRSALGVAYSTFQNYWDNKKNMQDSRFEALLAEHNIPFRSQAFERYARAQDMVAVVEEKLSTRHARAFVTLVKKLLSAIGEGVSLETEGYINRSDMFLVECKTCGEFTMKSRQDWKGCAANCKKPSKAIIAELCKASAKAKPQLVKEEEVVVEEKPRSPPLWPGEVEYINAIRTISGVSMRDFPLPPVRRDLCEMRVLPEGHPAHSVDKGLGVYATQRIRKPRTSDLVIGHYAGVLCPDRHFPFNPYIMCSDDAQNMIYDAFSCGNEMRFINAYNGVAKRPNVRMGAVCHVEGAPEWVTAREIVLLRSIEKGEELLLDYGDNYWDKSEAKAEHPKRDADIQQQQPIPVVVWEPMSGALVELDMDQMGDQPGIEEPESYRSSLFPGTFIEKRPQDRATVSVFGLPPIEVPFAALFQPRGSAPHTLYHIGQKVEVLWKGRPGSDVTRFDTGWWPATVIGVVEEGTSYRVIYKAAFGGFATEEIVDSAYMRPITENRLSSSLEPQSKKTKIGSK